LKKKQELIDKMQEEIKIVNELTDAYDKFGTKDVSAKGTKTYKYTSNNLYCTVTFPKSYGQLSSILDGNGFQNLDSWKFKEIEINSIPYYVYQTGTVVICNDFKYEFKH
jgi:hypothetical protein